MNHSSVIINHQRWMGFVIIVIALLVFSMTTMPVSAQGPGGPEPHVECITNNGDGTWTASFGYSKSPNGTNIAIGANNFFDPAPIDRGQPTTFSNGNNNFVVNADFPAGSSVTWTLTRISTFSATANNASPACPPIANPDSYFVTPNVARSVAAPGFLANDKNNSINPLVATLGTNVTNGNLVFANNGAFTYTPNPAFTGTDSFTYTINDGVNPQSAPATVTLTVETVAPTATADAYNTAFNTPLNVAAPGVLANDTDPNADPLTAILVGAPPANASSFTLNADGSFSYTPNSTFSGIDSFNYKANDGAVDSSTVSVSITVANGVPVANNDGYLVDFETQKVVDAPGVLFNDTDGNNQPLTATLDVGPTNAANFTLNGDGSFSYTPADTYSGPDSFTYTATDGLDTSNTATVNLTVANAVPVATGESYNTDFNTQLVVNAPGVLSNDTDGNGESLTAVQVSPPANASSFFLNSDGGFSYTPNITFVGDDTFTYKANDGIDDSNIVTVTITVANSLPIATGDAYNAPFNTQFVVNAPGILGNDTDANGTTLTAIKVSDPSNAQSFLLSSDGSFTYTPNATFSGEDSFTYKANDGTDDSNTVTVTITVANGVPVATNDPYNMNSNGTLNISAPGVLGNDMDGNGESLTAILVGGDPANASSFTFNADGSFDYTPNATFAGDDTFTYKANDGTDDSNNAIVTITVTNTVPSVTNDAYNTGFHTPISIVAPGVLGNDSDANGHGITAVKTSDPSNGTAVLNTDGSFTYTPNATFSGQDSFTYVANDGIGNSASATVTVNVANAIPVANGESYNVVIGFELAQGAPGVLGNDTDANLEALTAVLVSPPTHAASFTLNSNGSFNYTGTDLYVGPDSFTYYAFDGTDTSGTVTVNITVGQPNPAQRIRPSNGQAMDTGYFPLIWGHVPATVWYLNRLTDGTGNQVYSEWVKGEDVCDTITLICRVDYKWIKNNVYTWEMTTWNSTDGVIARETTTFSVIGSVPGTITAISPTNNQVITVAPDNLDLVWQDDYQTAWYRVRVLNANDNTIEYYKAWHERETICSDGTCTLVDPVWLKNGTYVWDILTWSPSGVGPQTNTTYTIQVPVVGTITRLTPSDDGTVSAGTVNFSWQHDTAVSWYQIILSGGPTAYKKWHRASDMNCGSGTCSLDLNVATGNYIWWMATWGPAGISGYSKTTFTAQ